MLRSLGIPVFAALVGLSAAFAPLNAKPVSEHPQYTPPESDLDVVGDPTAAPPAAKTLADTIWIADWSFDAPDGSCTDAGWIKYDNLIKNDGSNYWSIDDRFDGTGGIEGRAAVLSRQASCWQGYGNDWDYSILLKYRGAGSTLSFDFLSDSEGGYDFVTVEADSGGTSQAQVNDDPRYRNPEWFRHELFSATGPQSAGHVSAVSLPLFGAPATTHEVYIRFASDGGWSDEDGFYSTVWGAGLIVDDIVVTGGLAYNENFETTLDPNVALVNSGRTKPFGEWARLFAHVTDNDRCIENTTCSWLWSDPTLHAYFPEMAFGPGQAVVQPWLDDIIVSPWVSLASTPGATGTSLRFRRFPGNRFSQGPIVQGWRVRGKFRVPDLETPAPFDSVDCVTPWGHTSSFNTLTSFTWGDALDGTGRPFNMTPFFAPGATELQVSFRVFNVLYLAEYGPPATVNTGPGPYIDRVRIGRQMLSGPVINLGIDSRTQAQDCFPTLRNAIGPGEHFSPDGANRFGTCAFSMGAPLGSTWTPNLITGDSIALDNVVDARGAGGITSVKWYGAIVSGPHAGKAPTPYAVGGNGFFEVTADSARASSGSVVVGAWCIDLDDTYFRGGDALQYFWLATDASGGATSQPFGLMAPPASVPVAAAATGGLGEVNYLPTINWAPAYLARIAADEHGDLDPTAAEIAASPQANCILYYQHSNSARRSGDANRTAFMYTLDRLGYRGAYDVYDVQGYGDTNNQLGGRATVQQASGYALVIEDDGRSNLVPNIPDGSSWGVELIDQASWYRTYLAQGRSGLAGTASLWVIGENTAFEKAANALFTTDMGLSGIVNEQGLSVNPDVVGVASVTWANGGTTSFTGDTFSLNGGCPSYRAYDAANASGTAVRTHSYRSAATVGGGAIVLNSNPTLGWNTIWQGFAWFDMRSPISEPVSPDEEEILAAKVLTNVLPAGCLRLSDPATDTPDPGMERPLMTALHPNTPNPFNPTTSIRFDLSRSGHVELRIFDVAGRRVKTLVDARLEVKAGHTVTWNGMDEVGRPVASGVYFYHLQTADFAATRRLVVLR